MVKLGEKIKHLRKQKNISQEVFANYLGVSFQAISKWENGNTLPDVMMIPAIASFFGVSTDDLFDFNLFEMENNIRSIVDEHSKYWDSDIEKAEQIIRDGLKRYPGNETLLNCLIGVLSELHKNEEVINIGKALVETTKSDEIRIDTYRIMAIAYKEMEEYQLTKHAIEHIPELYFSKLEMEAKLLEGEEKYRAARTEIFLESVGLIDMLIIMGKHLKITGELESADSQFIVAKRIIDVFLDETIDRKDFSSNIFNAMSDRKKEVELLLSK